MAIQASQQNNFDLDKANAYNNGAQYGSANSYDRTKPKDNLWGLDEKGKPVYKHKELWGLDEKGNPVYKDVNSTNDSTDKNAAKKGRRFFSFGIKDLLKATYEDVTKTLWKVFAGANLVSFVRESLKNKKFSTEKVVAATAKTDTISKIFADWLGAISIRLFSGDTVLFGLKVLKLPAYFSSQIFSNLFVKVWRAMSSGKHLNTENADEAQTEGSKQVGERLKNLWWMKELTKLRAFYDKSVEPKLEKAFSFMLGIKSQGKDENGKERDPKINWTHFKSFIGLTGVGTFFLPKDTQNFGLESLASSKGFADSVKKSALTLFWTNLGRLESYFFNRAMTFHPKGFGMDACFESSVREKFLAPLVQNFADVLGTLMAKHTPFVNGAFMSSIVRLPFEIVAAFLSAEVASVAKATKVPDEWAYLSKKVWLPCAKVIEKFVKPVYKCTFGLVYKMFGLFPKDLNHLYLPFPDKPLDPKLEAKFANTKTWDVFKAAMKGIPGELRKIRDNVGVSGSKPGNNNAATKEKLHNQVGSGAFSINKAAA